MICPHFPDAFFLRFGRVISLALQQVREGLHRVPGCTQVRLRNLFALHHLADPESKAEAPSIILKQVKALLTPYLHLLSIVYFTSYPSGSSRDVAHKSCVTIKEAIHHAS